MNADFFMKLALEEAKKSGEDIPVGCIIVKNNEIISKAHNEKELKSDISAHAEILAIKEAEKKFGSWRLFDCDIYITLEPCPMCAFAILSAGIKKVYFGAYDINYGAMGSKLNMGAIIKKDVDIFGGIMEDECEKILVEYFKKIRK